MEALLGELRWLVGDDHVLTDADLVRGYCTDWTGHVGGLAAAVVRPADTTQTAQVLAACVRHAVPVIPQGGNTGLVLASIPEKRDERRTVIISTTRLDSVGPIDRLSGQVTVGAGASLADVQGAARAAGWEYGVDLAARESATIGGTVATNAGGIHVLAYGMTRAQVTGIEAVLAHPAPTVISHLHGLAKDNTGYDLAGALVGSEGTLAIITAVRVLLHRPMPRTSLALIGAESYADALELLSAAVRPGVRVRAAEVMDRFGIELALALIGQTWPLASAHEHAVLLEVADGGDASGFTHRLLADRDTIVALDAADQERLWALRERHTEAYGAYCTREGLPPAHKLDVSIPLKRLAACAEVLTERVSQYPQVVAFGMFGHIGDGNLHVQVCGPDVDDHAVDELVLRTVAEFGGSVSAEHGIGRLKAAWLHYSRSDAEIAVMQAIKAAWDPYGVMNPGVLLAD